MESNPIQLNKCAFIGAPAVGKTTLLKMLSDQEVSGQYIPTQGFDRGTVRINNHVICAWDFGGQQAFYGFWRRYILGSDLVCVVTDSTPINVLQTKQLIESLLEMLEDENVNIIAIANKQDVPGHMSASRVSNVLGIPAYPMVAINPNNREKMYQIIKRHLNKNVQLKDVS
ncbi:MAG: ADP-ribosylation factor-like protein [Promethearchaeota archaeon]